MNHFRQKPDALTPGIREEFKTCGVVFMEPPNGFGCDFIVFNNGVIFMEVKDPAEAERLTKTEQRLQRFCQFAGVPYIIVTTLDAALNAAGWTTI